MDLNNLKACIDHDEAIIQSFMRNPDYADYYLQAVLADGDAEEIAETQAWYNEAKRRTQTSQTLRYWKSVVENTEKNLKVSVLVRA